VDGKRGRKRSEQARVAILTATVDELTDKGYDSLSIEGIAARAGVGKHTIYRWWGSKGALIADCLVENLLPSPAYEPPDTGDVRADLTRWLGEAMDLIDDRTNRDVFRALVGAAAENPSVAEALNAQLGVLSALVRRLATASHAELRTSGGSLDALATAVTGTLIMRLLSPESMPGPSADQVVALLLPPGPDAPDR
jgi:AcrR family transcriptional regulator